MKKQAPSSFNQHIFFAANSVYYGTDDGYQDGSFGEFAALQSLYDNADQSRRENIHFVSAVGGLYGLNLMAYWRPKQITFFDINPHAIAYFKVVRRVFSISSSKRDFLDRLTNQDYDVESDAERTIRENLAMKQRGELSRSRGASYRRSLKVSWKHALDNFEVTRHLLTNVPLNLRTEGMGTASFNELVQNGQNIWMYCSNIIEFTYSKMRFDHPANAVVVSVVYPGQFEILDLSPFGNRPVDVHCEIPLAAVPVGERLIPDENPSMDDDPVAQELATVCRDQLKLAPDGRVLDVGCGWGRLAVALLDTLDEHGEYEGFDPNREQVQWAQKHVRPRHPNFMFHIANIANDIYNPDGRLRSKSFRFPYAGGRFDVVVAHSLFPYMKPEEFQHYLAEIARVLKPGGRLLTTFYMLNEETTSSLLSVAPPLCFGFESGPVVTTQPHRGGLLAYQQAYVQEQMARCGFDCEPVSYGSWRSDSPGLRSEDRLIATRRATA